MYSDNFAHKSLIISDCCNAFTVLHGHDVICTSCGKLCHQVEPNELVIVSNKYNINADAVNNGTLTINEWHNAMNYCDDPTYRLLNIKCKDCGYYCRFARDISKEPMYICSNPKCAHVFNEHDRIDNKVYEFNLDKNKRVV